jgi:aspartate 1-decarboxylase
VQRIMLKAKIHRARVTDDNIEYEGSITIDQTLMEAAGIVPFEQVHIYNVTNGNRFITYAIAGKPDSGTVCVNGAAAHKASRDDVIIIACYGSYNESEYSDHRPQLVYVDEANRITHIKS